jgi:hypothetical protein
MVVESDASVADAVAFYQRELPRLGWSGVRARFAGPLRLLEAENFRQRLRGEIRQREQGEGGGIEVTLATRDIVDAGSEETEKLPAPRQDAGVFLLDTMRLPRGGLEAWPQPPLPPEFRVWAGGECPPEQVAHLSFATDMPLGQAVAAMTHALLRAGWTIPLLRQPSELAAPGVAGGPAAAGAPAGAPAGGGGLRGVPRMPSLSPQMKQLLAQVGRMPVHTMMAKKERRLLTIVLRSATYGSQGSITCAFLSDEAYQQEKKAAGGGRAKDGRRR